MTAILRKDFMYLFVKNSSYLCKSRVSFSISPFQLYTTSSEKKPAINATVYDFLLHKHNFSHEAASKTASVLTRLRNPKKSDSILSFLKQSGFSNTHLEKMLKCRASFIVADLEKSIKPKIKIFQDMGFSNNDIADMIARDALIFHRSLNNRVIPSLSLLKSLLGSDAEVVKLLMKSGWFLDRDLNKSLVPNLEFLKSRSVPIEEIISCLYSFPRFLLQKPEIIRKCVDKADEMGVKTSSKMYIHAVRVVGSMSDEAWKLKLQAFRSLGFSEDDILKAFRKSPPAFAVSVNKIKKVKELLVSSGKYDLACIISHPSSLISSIEKRYKPRLQVLSTLESQKLIKKWPSLSTLRGISNKVFFEKFVSPYIDEVGDVFVAESATSGKPDVKLVPSA